MALTPPAGAAARLRASAPADRRLCSADWIGGLDRHPDVVGADAAADQEQQAADGAGDVIGMHRDQRVDEGIGERAALVVGPPHQPLDDAGIPHREDVDRPCPPARTRNAPPRASREYMASRFHSHGTDRIDRAEGDHGDPAERAGMDMADGPVGVMGERIDRADRHERPSKVVSP